MSPDFWAGYISGAAGILIGNPLDLIKVRLQAGSLSPFPTGNTPASTIASSTSYRSQFSSAGTLIRGATAPILGCGALNALLFVTYNRSASLLHGDGDGDGNNAVSSLWTTWIAGAIGGLATWAVSTPTELVKCRAQVSEMSSWAITKEIVRSEGVRGLYFGGVVTALRDSIGYGFYFWSYELSTRFMVSRFPNQGLGAKNKGQEAAKVLLCGGLAGVVTWASIFPLDVIKTRVQTQLLSPLANKSAVLLGNARGGISESRKSGAIDIAKNAYRSEGSAVFFRGLTICSVRAFVVNAAQWAIYEWAMDKLDPARRAAKMSSVQDTSL